MIVDTSALLAILQNEAERRAFNEVLEQAVFRRLSMASFVEVSIVVEARYGAEGLRDLDLLLDRAGFELVPVDLEQGKEARRAFSRYGRGRHPAGLNYGDCFSYALAKVSGESLLFKGEGFSRTDVVPALPGNEGPESAARRSG